MSGHSDRTGYLADPDGFESCQTDVSACDTHSNLGQNVKRSNRTRKKPAYLGSYVCTIKSEPTTPKNDARKQKTRYDKTGKKFFSTSEDRLASEGLPSSLAYFCSSLLPDAYTTYTDSQTVTTLGSGPVLTNTDNAVRSVSADQSVSGCRFVVMPGQRWCEFCSKLLVSVNSVRRHLLLHHRRIYVQHGDCVYVDDDNEYADRCAKLRHNRSHRRAAARRRETATASVSAGKGTRPAQNKSGTMTPQDKCGSMTPQGNRGTMTPQSNRGTKAPQKRQGTATRQQLSRAARGNPAANIPLPVASAKKPMFYVADCEVQLESTDDTTPEPRKVRGVSEGERAVVYLDAVEQFDFTPDFLDDSLYGHAKELDSEVGVLDSIGMSAGNAGLNLVEYTWASGEEDMGTTGGDGSPPSTVVCAEPSATTEAKPNELERTISQPRRTIEQYPLRRKTLCCG